MDIVVSSVKAYVAALNKMLGFQDKLPSNVSEEKQTPVAAWNDTEISQMRLEIGSSLLVAVLNFCASVERSYLALGARVKSYKVSTQRYISLFISLEIGSEFGIIYILV